MRTVEIGTNFKVFDREQAWAASCPMLAGPQILKAFSDQLPCTVRSFINDLVNMGFLHRVDVRLLGNIALYDLTRKGRDFYDGRLKSNGGAAEPRVIA